MSKKPKQKNKKNLNSLVLCFFDIFFTSFYMKLKIGNEYQNIYFSGSGYLNMFHLGFTLCMMDYSIRFKNAYSTSGGAVGAISILLNSQDSFDYIFVSMLKIRFSKTHFFGKNHLSNVIRKFLLVLYENFPVEPIHKNVYFGARTTSFESKWFQNFSSEKEFIDAVCCTTRLVPFISLNSEFGFIDQICITEIPNCETIDCSVTPFYTMMLPQSNVKIIGNTPIWNVRKILLPTIEEMFMSFIDGYQCSMSQIQNANHIEKKRDIYDYCITMFKKYKNWEYKIDIPKPDETEFWLWKKKL